jgi:hypothetical protein
MMKLEDSEFIKELKKFKYHQEWYNGDGTKEIAFFMKPRQWTEFRNKFNKDEK